MRNGMKRFFAGTLAFMMMFAMTGCKANAQTLGAAEKEAMAPIEETVTPIEHVTDEKTGGWSAAEDTALTDDQRSLFERALEGLLGVNYEPIAYLGSQVVAGLNHCFLCKATVVYPGAQPTYKLVYIYEDLNGNTEVTDIVDLAGDGSEVLPGGWSIAEDAAMTEDVQAAFDKAMESLLGVDYEPVAVIGSQVVAGMNYKILCRSTVVAPGAQPGYSLVTIYNALDGHAEVLEITDVTL